MSTRGNPYIPNESIAQITYFTKCGTTLLETALALELTARGIPFQKELDLDIEYKGQKLARSYRADFVCFDSVIVELKALSGLTTIEQSQVLNYLKATGLERALLLNFGKGKLEFKRLILSSHLRPSASSADNSS